MKKKIISSVLALMLVVGCLPLAALAAQNDIDAAQAPTYNESTNEFFAGGTPITIEDTDEAGKAALIKWDGGQQLIAADAAVYGGSDTVSSNIHLSSTSITMNGGQVKDLVGGNKTKNEKSGCDYSLIDTVTLDINGGTITRGLHGIDNQHTAFGADVRKEQNGKSYKNYAIGDLNVTIDGATVNDFRGVTSYAYAENVDVVVGRDAAAQLKGFMWGTNGIIGNATFTMYSGSTDIGQSILRCCILGKMTYNILGGEIGDIYAGSYYPAEETAAGSNNWDGWGFGGVDYGFVGSTEINVGADAKYNDIISGFQYREDVEIFKNKYADASWCIKEIDTTAPIVLNLSARPSAEKLDAFSVIGSDASYVTTNWKATGITLDQNELLLNAGGRAVQLNASVLPEYSTDSIVWTTSAPEVAEVLDGRVDPRSAGTAIITATAGDVSAQCEVTVYEVEEPQVPTIDPSKPVDKVEVGSTSKTPVVISSSANQLVTEILAGKAVDAVDEATKEAVKQAAESGKAITAAVSVELMDESQVTEADKALIKESAGKVAGGAVVAQYLDLKVLLTADGVELGTLNKLNSAASFTIAVPEELKADGRIFHIARLHDGKVDLLETVQNEDGTLTFSTDRFSTYALVYLDGSSGGNGNNGGETTTPGGDSTTDTGKGSDSANTGDVLPIAVLGAARAISAGAVLTLRGKQSKFRHMK